MHGTPWTQINGLDTSYSDTIVVDDCLKGDLYRQISIHLYEYNSDIYQLVYFSPSDLGLTPQSTPTSVLCRAKMHGMELVPYVIALRIMQKNPFRVSPWKKLVHGHLPFQSCLLGIRPLIGLDNEQYTLEVTKRQLRFRRISGGVNLCNMYWVFAQKLIQRGSR